VAIISDVRVREHGVDPAFLNRWSPRAFTGEPIPDETLLTMFEAARWAPSCFNMQPWRFLYARKDSEHWLRFLHLLIPYNQDWAKDASVLGVVVSKTLLERPNRDPVPAHSHSYDAGAAWMSLALQASRLGWAAHGMIGFDIERTYLELCCLGYVRLVLASVKYATKDSGMQGLHASAENRWIARELFHWHHIISKLLNEFLSASG